MLPPWGDDGQRWQQRFVGSGEKEEEDEEDDEDDEEDDEDDEDDEEDEEDDETLLKEGRNAVQDGQREPDQRCR